MEWDAMKAARRGCMNCAFASRIMGGSHSSLAKMDPDILTFPFLPRLLVGYCTWSRSRILTGQCTEAQGKL